MSLDLDTITLGHGSHLVGSGEGCVMEWVSVLAGEPWSDSPACTSPVIAAFLRSWNDALPDGERQQLRRYIPLVIGTRGTAELEAKRAWMATDWLVRVQAPAWLRLAGLTDQAQILEGMPEITSATVPSIKAPLEAVRKDAAAAWAAAWDAAGDAARDAAWDAAGAAAWDAAGAAARAAARDAAGDAAGDAAWAAAWAAAWDAAGDAARAAARAAAWAAAGAAAWAAAGDAAWAAAWDAARDAAGAAAWDAARDALEPTKVELQGKAHDLLTRMIEAA